MKKMLLSLVLALMAPMAASAMSYEEAREQALFLTDKMAYELNLNDEQYEYCYEINLDYLMGVQTADDVYGVYLTHRNADLRHILFDWQYSLFCAADYFFHPLIWHRGVWSLPIYRYYTYGHFFYHRPHVYLSYRGGHGRFYFGGGYYGNRRPHWNGGLRGLDRGAIAHRGDFNRGGVGRGSVGRGGTRSGSFGRNDNGRIGGSRIDGGRVDGGRTRSFGSTRSVGNTRSTSVTGNRTGSFGSSHSVGSSRSIGSSVGSRSVTTPSHSAVGSSRPSTNDARVGSFSRGSGSYSHQSSTRSIGGSSMRSSSPSMGASRGSSFGGSRGGSIGGGSMGSSRGGAMGGSHGGGHGRGR